MALMQGSIIMASEIVCGGMIWYYSA